MSTRGWYEYYVLDRSARTMSKAMQCYVWGDPGPAGAVEEWAMLEDITEFLDRRPPLRFLNDMLDDNLGAAKDSLPPGFALGLYYFLLQRAAQEESGWPAPWRVRGAPKEEQPDFQLGFAVGEAQVLMGYRIPAFDHRVVDRAHFSIKVGKLVRRWRECSARMTFLGWVQYLSQITEEVYMGLVAGHYEQPWDVSERTRLFFEVPSLEEPEPRVEAIRIELCEGSDGSRWDELADDIERSLDEGVPRVIKPKRVRACFERAMEAWTTLEALRGRYELVTSPMWEGRLPRNGYLGP